MLKLDYYDYYLRRPLFKNKNNIKYFQAAHPEKILKELKEKEEEFKKILPKLISLSDLPKEETTAEVYKGKEGIKTVLREILRNKEDHLVLGDEGHFIKLLPDFFHQHLDEQKRRLAVIKEKTGKEYILPGDLI